MEDINRKICKRGFHFVDRCNFGKETRSKDGLASSCKACIKIKNKKLYQRRENDKAVALENSAEQIQYATRPADYNPKHINIKITGLDTILSEETFKGL